MDDPVFKSKYQKYKYKVKLWEKSFQKINGRIPSKHDIREAPRAIVDAYKMYYKLKSSFLEDTLNDVLDEDGFDISMDNSQLHDSSSTSFSLPDPMNVSDPNLPSLTDIESATSAPALLNGAGSFSNINEIEATSLTNLRNVHDGHVIREFEAETDEGGFASINDNAWGAELNKKGKSEKKAPVKAASQEVRMLVTDKLFRNSSFSKRNPRKSLSRANSLANTSSGDPFAAREILPDLEMILLEKAKKQQQLEEEQKIGKPVTAALTPTLRAVDTKWLNRCNAANSLGPTDENISNNVIPATTEPVKFGLTNLNVPLVKPDLPVQTHTGSETPTLPQPPDVTTVKVKEIYALATTYDNPPEDDDDEDGVIENSEDEAPAQDISHLRHVLKKRKIHDVRPDPPAPPVEPIVDKPKATKPKATKTKATKPKAAKTPKAAKSNENLAEERKIIEPTRRSTRATRNTKTQSIGLSEDFDGDDSDKDPEFSPTDKKNISYAEDDDEDETDVEEEQNHQQSETANKPKKVKKEKQVKEPKKPGAAKAGYFKNGKYYKNQETWERSDEEDTPQDYIMEFGTDDIQSVPRIDINELQENNDMFERYVLDLHNPSGPQTKNAADGAPVNFELTKREKDRAKLEKKIASGSLNENFVRVNLQKKVFVRGHKSVNFSRYKKTQWKKTKAANALAGPEMDMRGCDGGFLVCFTCGQQGHFAADCKMQADRLLSLAADVEVSDYPTLEEVEQMAAEGAVYAHSRNISNMPSQSNSKWKDDLADSETEQMEHDEIEEEDDGPGEQTPTHPEPQKHTVETPKPYIGHTIPEEFRKLAGLDEVTAAQSDAIQPLYDLNADGEVIGPTDEVMAVLKMFGHTSFRKGQDRAVMRVLSGMSTLVTLSTGSGKSLCYQLPAYLYRQKRRCITLVISPLVSLMEDQVHDVPHFLNAQCLHTFQTKQVRAKIMESIKSGEVDVLLISPEAVVAGEKSTGFGSLLRELPPIAFVCIDEAHCMSQWSHNFRPSYLMICRVLQEKLKVKTVLGLTATATYQTRESIVRHLAIPDGIRGVISDIPLPNNLLLTVSKDRNRDVALVKLLKSNKFKNYTSIIVYCTRRDECERVAKYIRMCFQEEEKQMQDEDKVAQESKKRKRVRSIVEFYHAGMPGARRKKIQNEFMRSDLKIVVATIAFGMGINKADIRAVIHYNMPMTYENYTQEVGRAGRDGKDSHCHLFLDPNKNDLVELRRHIFANSIDRHVIRKLLQKVFVPCACANNKEYQNDIDALQTMNWSDDMDVDEVKCSKPAPAVRKCAGHEGSFSVDGTVQELDIPEENIATLLCYLELHEQRYIQVLSKAYCTCKVLSYGGANSLKLAARTCPPLAMAIALDLKRGISHQNSTVIEFQVVDIASAIGWNSGVVKYQLKNLEWTTVNGANKRSTLSVQFTDLGFRVRSPGDLSDDELDSTLDMLHNRVVGQEKMQVIQLQNVFNGLSAKAYDVYSGVLKDADSVSQSSDALKVMIRDYFQSTEIKPIEDVDQINTDDVCDDQLVADIRTMISRYPENNFTGRSLARIFHGIASPVYPAQVWSRCNYWRQYTKVDFNRIVKLGNAEIVKMRT